MAALLKEEEFEQWSKPVSNEGFAKLLKAIEDPKKPSDALKRLMLSYKKSK
ncbi:hypothetical protein IVA95_31320 [Bradyrhizobium sp. 157]|uniref:hypothetical protein n=1 Tax=Bradyrhizobium sp. 157 TaxID=2782631 RepID=UPI001FF8C9CA|nr:hypothetical protein [Bradyrhizobium sp. 157]MCK1641919.1 hypothetical protein [Bradyrhizobium sp. 157]